MAWTSSLNYNKKTGHFCLHQQRFWFEWVIVCFGGRHDGFKIFPTAISSHKLGRWYDPSTWKKRCHISLLDEMDNQRREAEAIATKIIGHTFIFWPVLWLKPLLFAGPEPSDTDSTTEKLLEGFSHRSATSIWSITSGVWPDHKPTLLGQAESS